MDIISVQSRVTWGFVGNAAAIPVLQALGVNGWPIDTVRLSHHPGHGASARFQTGAEELIALFDGTLARSKKPVAVMMGYLGSSGQGHAIVERIVQKRGTGADLALYLDPAFGDDPGGTYVDPDIITFYRDTALGHATVVMPNRYELTTLSGVEVTSAADAVAAAHLLMDLGCQRVMASSIPMPGGQLGNVLVWPDGALVCTSDRKSVRSKGTGDLLSAAFCGAELTGRDPASALGLASAIVESACSRAAAHDLVELDMIALLANIHGGITHKSATPLPKK